jgi:hypothetical protein
MMKSTLRSILLAIATFVAGFAYSSHVASFLVQIENGGKVDIEVDKKHFRIPLAHAVDGYDVDCSKNYLVAWGKPFNMGSSSPQNTEASVISLINGNIIGNFQLSRGIFGVEYLTRWPLAILDTDTGTLVNLLTQEIMPTPDFGDFDAAGLVSEECPTFEFKTYRRYSDK